MLDLSSFSNNLPAVAATFAAAITAAFASIKYYSDKAAKVTEFRKAWVESLRQAVAEFSGSTHTIAGRIAIRSKAESDTQKIKLRRSKIIQIFSSLFKNSATPTTPVEKELATELLTHWSTLRLSYNKIILHLNPSEHQAYTIAENAIAKHTSMTTPNDAIRIEVTIFLNWCIEISQQRAQFKKYNKIISFFGPKKSTFVSKLQIKSLTLCQAQEEIDDTCINSGSSLLLSAFATRQLLHGSYKNVFNNIESIERGIRVVDTSAAIVIKGVWETIKKGEPAYRWTSRIAILASIALIAGILIILLNNPSKNTLPKNQFISCKIISNVIANKGQLKIPETINYNCNYIIK